MNTYIKYYIVLKLTAHQSQPQPNKHPPDRSKAISPEETPPQIGLAEKFTHVRQVIRTSKIIDGDAYRRRQDLTSQKKKRIFHRICILHLFLRITIYCVRIVAYFYVSPLRCAHCESILMNHFHHAHHRSLISVNVFNRICARAFVPIV